MHACTSYTIFAGIIKYTDFRMTGFAALCSTVKGRIKTLHVCVCLSGWLQAARRKSRRLKVGEPPRRLRATIAANKRDGD